MTARLLVADDEPDMRTLLRIRLEREGYVVDVVPSGEDALEMWRSRDYAAAVLDQRMGGITGMATAEALRSKGFHGPIVLFSAYLEQPIEDAAESLGIATLAKSEIGELSAVVADMLDVDGGEALPGAG